VRERRPPVKQIEIEKRFYSRKSSVSRTDARPRVVLFHICASIGNFWQTAVVLPPTSANYCFSAIQ